MIAPRHDLIPLLLYSIIVFAFLTPAPDVRAQTATSDDKASASIITGRVVTKDGAPISSARVTLTRMGERLSQTGLRVDGRGEFKTEPLEPGSYFVSAGAAGYVVDPSLTQAPTFYHPGNSVTVTMFKGGVITGTIKDSNGDPVVTIPVRANRVRDQDGRVVQIPIGFRDRLTDDRGVYRIYDLPPGAYVVSAGGPARAGRDGPPTAFERDAPTYAPASTIDTAVEVTLNSGDELTVDIQYRSEPGHAISGIVSGLKNDLQFSGAVVSLIDVGTGTEIGITTSFPSYKYTFAFFGVADGEYELYATQNSSTGALLMSAPKRVKVQGSDLTEILLPVAPLASITGRVIVESDPKASCGERRSAAMLETIVFARRQQVETKSSNAKPGNVPQVDSPLRFQDSTYRAMIDAKGTLNLRDLQPGTYRIDPREPASGWYLRSIALDSPAKNPNIARDGLKLATGERLSGLSVTLAEGAGQLKGQIATGQSTSQALRVYLVPAEPEAADNVLRFYEARPEADQSFTIDNINPGKYRIVAHSLTEKEIDPTKSIRRDSSFRTKISQEAAAAKKEISFKPCERLVDYELPFVP